jgi:hypothetical protein
MEKWRTIEGFPDYEISSEGRVRSWKRRERKWRNPCDGRRDEPMILKGTIHPLGYIGFILRKEPGGKPYRRTAHRLVAIAFLPNPGGLRDVAHNDGNPANNQVDNLRWSTHRDNQMDMRRHGTMQDGEKCITAKLTPADVESIRAAIAAGGRGTSRRLAGEYGLSVAQISRIKNGHRWRGLLPPAP